MGRELVGSGGRLSFEPRVAIGVDRALQSRVELGGNAFAVEHDHRANPLYADALDEAVGTLQVFGVLSIVLDEAPREAHDFFFAAHRAEQIAFTHVGSRRAAD